MNRQRPPDPTQPRDSLSVSIEVRWSSGHVSGRGWKSGGTGDGLRPPGPGQIPSSGANRYAPVARGPRGGQRGKPRDVTPVVISHLIHDERQDRPRAVPTHDRCQDSANSPPQSRSGRVSTQSLPKVVHTRHTRHTRHRAAPGSSAANCTTFTPVARPRAQHPQPSTPPTPPT